ncbi:GMC family oxidoreductase [Paractinoplanes atraurantiacus]|uniref:Choline dehydrogenase n=1 Tax=Paractinoplanes atraurantiacus TaxID=1036182 RepID=A0A285JX90_9ACTN|nr:GMC family oxidoreductase N-terminal domain-containing protein [Actinoplanes atraurantiacus]SNY64663.1 choline dehydrogenase [Actinoplanes atraurantiacus]
MNTYDVVLVGGGTAGSVLAARLSERDDLRVLLLEAGDGVPLPAMSDPPAWPTLVRTVANWGELIVPQGAVGAVTPLPRGKGLGGGSSINAMLFTRGHHTSYERWVQAGAKNWGYYDLLPYFKRSENAPGRDPVLRGRGGPLTVAPPDPVNPVLAAALGAAVEAGQRRAGDISGGLEEGFAPVDVNIVDGRRQSAADAYLNPVRERPNLTVVTGALAHRLVIDNGRCTGVVYSAGSEVVTVSAGEVILTAGTIGSAQLMMLSGLGPAAHLREHGIEVVADLPGVGSGLQDHPIANVVYRSSRPVPTPRHNHGEVIGLVRSRADLPGPDLQLIFVDLPRPVNGHAGPDQGYTIGVSLMMPHSRGTVRLAGAAPGSHPLLDPNYYGDPRDLDAVVAGIRLARRIGRGAALDDWRDTEVIPGPATDDEDALRDYARRAVASYCHPVGTLAMGDGPAAVVDTGLRVRGFAGLWVADASVMPAIPSGNTNATVYAIAERAAELLLDGR